MQEQACHLHPDALKKQRQGVWLQGEEMPRKQGAAAAAAAAAPLLVAVAVDKDKNSQNALRWTLDNVVGKGQTVNLVHVHAKAGSGSQDSGANDLKELFAPFRSFCRRRDVQSNEIVMEESDVARAIIEFATQAALDMLVIGSSTKGFMSMRFKVTDLAGTVLKGAPDFCTVYVISKNRISSVRRAARDAPFVSPLRAQILNQASAKSEQPEQHGAPHGVTRGEAARESRYLNFDNKSTSRSARRPGAQTKVAVAESDISFVGSSKHAMEQEFLQRADGFEQASSPSHTPRSSVSAAPGTLSHTNSTSLKMEDVAAEMNRLRLELKQTVELYSKACKEALLAKHKAAELQQLKEEEAQKLQQARLAEESAWAMVERERAMSRAAMDAAAEAAKRVAELEARAAEEEEAAALRGAAAGRGLKCRRYSIEEIRAATEEFAEARKIGEGGYGPVYRCRLDHTPVAVKALRPGAAHGRAQFEQEVEILSCVRHPNMVLLLGACPERGCLVYEYMPNGSLEDRLVRRGGTPPIPWPLRFRIAAEVGTALLFLHQARPEPLVHRDLKPANVLLDRNYVSKISDVGLARLVPPPAAGSATRYRMTSAAGTFCYIDPEYQQSGMLGTKSDVYSLGVLLLQLVTARPPMGLARHAERAIEEGRLADLLDPAVPDWPAEEALALARLALRCVELRRKDRPDLAGVVLPELDRLRAFGEQSMQCCSMWCPPCRSPVSYRAPPPDEVSDRMTAQTESSQDGGSAGDLRQ